MVGPKLKNGRKAEIYIVCLKGLTVVVVVLPDDHFRRMKGRDSTRPSSTTSTWWVGYPPTVEWRDEMAGQHLEQPEHLVSYNC